jgi:hypothetical protein
MLKCAGCSYWKGQIPWHVTTKTSKSSILCLHFQHPNKHTRTPLHQAATWAAINTFEKRNQPWETARLLISKGASDALIDDVTVIKYFNGPRSMFNFLQQHMYPSYREIPPQTRFDIVARICNSRWHNVPAILSTLLRAEADFDKELLTLTNHRGHTLLHLLVIGLVEVNITRPDDSYLDDDLSSEEVEEVTVTKTYSLSWRRLICKVVAAGADLNALDAWGRTPLCTLIHRYSIFFRRHLFNRRLGQLHILGCWLQDLFDVGIDLLQYGALESLAVQKRRDQEPTLECACSIYYGSGLKPEECERSNECCSPTRLINLHYGTRPEDWIFWLSEKTDEFVGDFWSMIEEPVEFEAEDCPMVLKMPGSWNEAEDSSSDEE